MRSMASWSPIFCFLCTSREEKKKTDDFLGRAHKGKTLRSFGVNSGGYLGYFDSEKGDHDTFTAQGDAVAARQLKLKSQMKGAQRGICYQRYANQLRGKRV